MISNKLIQSMVFNDCLSSRPVIDVPVDAGDDGVVVTMVDVMVGVFIDLLVDTIIGSVADIGLDV